MSDVDLLWLIQAYLAALARSESPTAEEELAWQEFYATYDPLIRRVI